MTGQNLPLAELTNRAIDILSRELGAVDTIRFIRQFTNGHGDYTVERDAFIGSMTLDQVIADIKASRPPEDAAPSAGPDR